MAPRAADARTAAGGDSAGRIQLLNVNHPGRKGARIDAAKYAAVKKAILAAVPRSKEGVPFLGLHEEVAKRLPRGLFEGASVSWYTTAVKLDLEARSLIERIPGSTPQRLRRTSTARARG